MLKQLDEYMQQNNSFSLKYGKRLFDVVFALLGLFFGGPVIIIAWGIAAFETRSNGFFVQSRIGQFGKPFNVIKIKTMKPSSVNSTTVTTSNDARITKSGAFFRNTKIDELPQFWNVLLGEMSFVGPRPDVEGYADQLKGDDRIVLTVRPGITGPASLKYRNEEQILSGVENAKDYNDTVIWPDKVNINKAYIREYSFLKDINYIIKTIKD